MRKVKIIMTHECEVAGEVSDEAIMFAFLEEWKCSMVVDPKDEWAVIINSTSVDIKRRK